ncbi:hypothetical protein [Bradyrhizobium liaoningense]|uniref:hypothetical protein n=1 Tax=Bradyrhizobium liaoningense TaxID=43992 RepID=UPI001BAD0232|nr:hypothetical protein [Bradyrhizobium liaoningense]MBR0858978.1 hypothetical protein [Bradyrhizobium liaoningense]
MNDEILCFLVVVAQQYGVGGTARMCAPQRRLEAATTWRIGVGRFPCELAQTSNDEEAA